MVVGYLEDILKLLNTPEYLFQPTYAYIRIILLGMTCSMIYNVCASILRAIGDSISPLIFLIFSTVLNIGLDLFMIGRLQMGVEGAALATVLSQLVSAVLCLVYSWVRYPMLRLHKSDFLLTGSLVRQLLQAGISMGLMNSLVSLGTVALQRSINTFGTTTIVAHSAARKLTELFMLVFSVFGTTMATYASQNYGAGKPKRIRQGIRFVLVITWIWCGLTVIASYTIAPKMIYWVTKMDQKEVIDTAVRYLRFNSVFYFVTAVITVFRNTMQGIGDHRTPIISSFIELAGKVLIVICLTPYLQYDGIIISEPIVWILMVIPLIVQMMRNKELKKES